MKTENQTPTEPACWRLDACSEASASYHASAACYRRTEDVLIFPVIVAKLELSKVQRQIFFAYMVEAPHNPAFQQAPERFDIVGMNFATNIFALAVAHCVMRKIFFQE